MPEEIVDIEMENERVMFSQYDDGLNDDNAVDLEDQLETALIPNHPF